MGILKSYVLDEIDSDVALVATQVGELMKRNIKVMKKCTQQFRCTFSLNLEISYFHKDEIYLFTFILINSSEI